MATKKKLLQAAAGAAGGAALNVEDVFSTYLYEGTGATLEINNGIDLSGEGGLVWQKVRSSAGYRHFLFDTERTFNKYISSNTTDAESSLSALSSFDSDGVTLTSDGNVNGSGIDSVLWTFRKAPKFFTCLTYTGTGSAQTISHDLGTTVGTLIVKRTDTTGDWLVQHRSLGGTYYMDLQNTNAAATNTSYWNNTTATSTEFTVGTSSYTNASGGTYVAYLFAHNDGDGNFGPDGDADIIKCGSVSYNGGASVDLGFEPQWVLIKPSNNTGNWILNDVMRGMPNGSRGPWLQADTSSAELANATVVYPTSTGFTMPAFLYDPTDLIYIAIRRGPMAAPESATDVFAIDEMDNSPTAPPTLYSGFPVDMAFYTNKSATSDRHISSRMIGSKLVQTNKTDAEISYTYAEWDFMDGWFSYAGALSNYYSWMWRRAPNFFDVVAEPIASAQMSGPASSSYNPSHNLGVTPEMIWVKDRDNSDNWYVYHSALGTSQKLILNSTAAASSSSWAVASDNFNFYAFGNSTGNAICYLFATLAGVSKVGSYTGNGSTQNIDCGFSSGARFVLIKCSSDGLTDWHVMDSTRGIVAGNDPWLMLNDTAAEDTGEDIIDPYSSGFALPANNRVNTSGRTYIFYAIA